MALPNHTGFCPCALCEARTTAALAASRATAAIQAAAWHPRSRRLAAEAVRAVLARDAAIAAL